MMIIFTQACVAQPSDVKSEGLADFHGDVLGES